MKDVSHFTIATTVYKADRHRPKPTDGEEGRLEGDVKLADFSVARATFVPFVN